MEIRPRGPLHDIIHRGLESGKTKGAVAAIAVGNVVEVPQVAVKSAVVGAIQSTTMLPPVPTEGKGGIELTLQSGCRPRASPG